MRLVEEVESPGGGDVGGRSEPARATGSATNSSRTFNCTPPLRASLAMGRRPSTPGQMDAVQGAAARPSDSPQPRHFSATFSCKWEEANERNQTAATGGSACPCILRIGHSGPCMRKDRILGAAGAGAT
jgi:hypothetical protein